MHAASTSPSMASSVARSSSGDVDTALADMEGDDDRQHRGEVSRGQPGPLPTSFEAFAALLDLNGSGYYTVRAYWRARSSSSARRRWTSELVRAGRVRELAGIGPGIETRLRELVETGRMAEMDELEAQALPELVGVARLLGLSPRRIRGAWPRPRHPHAAELQEAAGRGTARHRAGDRAEDGGQIESGLVALSAAAAARHAAQPGSWARGRDRRRARRGACRMTRMRAATSRPASPLSSHSSGSGGRGAAAARCRPRAGRAPRGRRHRRGLPDRNRRGAG